jgi:hypothetical protein
MSKTGELVLATEIFEMPHGLLNGFPFRRELALT